MAIYRLNQKIAGQVSTYSVLSDKPQINSHELSGNLSGTALGLVDAVSGSSLVPDSKVDSYDAHVADSTIHVTSSDKSTWSAKQDALGASNKLSADYTADGTTNKVFTSVEKTKLSGIASGAEVNVQSNWTESDTTSDSYIQNKPSQFTPSTHASTHGNAGTDRITIDATQVTSGILSVDRIPQLAYQRMVTVATEADKDALTSADVAVGDTVYVQQGNKLYIVSSITDIGETTEVINYVIYTAYVSWNSVTGVPSSFTPSPHATSTDTYGKSTATNYGHAKASSTNPSDLGASASTGTDNGEYARGDHVHKIPSTLEGLTATVSELNYCDGVTSAIQTQIDGKATPSDISSAITTHNSNASAHSDIRMLIGTKQPIIDSSHKLSADLVSESSTNKFNVQSDWSASSGLSAILNKPTEFTPSEHKTSHELGGADALTLAESQITNLTADLAGKQAVIDSSNKLSADLVDDTTATNKFYHTHASSHASGGSDAITIAESQVTNLVSDLAGKQGTLTASTNVTLSGNTISVVGTDTATSGSTALMTSGGLFKRIQYGSSAPSSPNAGDVWIKTT